MSDPQAFTNSTPPTPHPACSEAWMIPRQGTPACRATRISAALAYTDARDGARRTASASPETLALDFGSSLPFNFGIRYGDVEAGSLVEYWFTYDSPSLAAPGVAEGNFTLLGVLGEPSESSGGNGFPVCGGEELHGGRTGGSEQDGVDAMSDPPSGSRRQLNGNERQSALWTVDPTIKPREDTLSSLLHHAFSRR
ncbi:hypothetical protein PG993_013719 [Apiospora rasikravindrae]|uniref:Uncharacterized protein n=1 Tax=Apiospora rasikravindrae TaxID=990691 RepID=A0ABR1RR43_9PEZI